MSQGPKNINPNFIRKQGIKYSWEECVEGIREGQTNILATLISKAESNLQEDQDFIQKLIAETNVNRPTRKLSISGPPGVGKSSFIDVFGSYLIKRGFKIAVLPVDPSSYISKGSILGDKTRMETLANSEMAFIKPMSSSLSLGGLAPASAIAIMICERANFDYIIMETVGVGQSEVEARDLVDLFMVLLQPGGGDDLQGIKRGIMELADIFVVTKTDGSLLENANRTTKEINQATALMLANSYGWKAGVYNHSAVLSEGNETLFEAIENYYSFMSLNGRLESLHKEQNLKLFEKRSSQLLIDHMLKKKFISAQLMELNAKINTNEASALEALQNLKNILDGLS